MIINNQYIDSNTTVSIRYNRDFNQLQIDAGNFEYFFNISTNLDFQTLYMYLVNLKNYEIVDIDGIEAQVRKYESNMFGDYLTRFEKSESEKSTEDEKSK